MQKCWRFHLDYFLMLNDVLLYFSLLVTQFVLVLSCQTKSGFLVIVLVGRPFKTECSGYRLRDKNKHREACTADF